MDAERSSATDAAMLAPLFDVARQQWPDIELRPEAFWSHVRHCLEGHPPSPETVRDLHLGDLYLACACARGDDKAIAAFRQRFHPAIAHAIRHAAPRALAEEIGQRVLEKLFVGGPEREPAIGSFLGTGKLSTWVQVVARREARTHLRAEDRRRGRGERVRDELEMLSERAVDSSDVALASLKERYRAEFRHAFGEALASLEARDRNMLRYECIDGLTRDQIAAIYGVSRATVARWRAQCRQALFRATREAFARRVELPTGEFDSVLRLIESQIHVSVSRLLKATDR